MVAGNIQAHNRGAYSPICDHCKFPKPNSSELEIQGEHYYNCLMTLMSLSAGPGWPEHIVDQAATQTSRKRIPYIQEELTISLL